MMSKSWVHDSLSDTELNLNVSKLFRNDRLCSVGCGCMLYVKEFYKTLVSDDLTNVTDSESVCCALTGTMSSLGNGVCYTNSATVVNEVALHNAIRQAYHIYEYYIFIL